MSALFEDGDDRLYDEITERGPVLFDALYYVAMSEGLVRGVAHELEKETPGLKFTPCLDYR